MTKQTEQVDRPYGIRITYPEGSPMAAPHLLGPDWEAYQWFETARERDRAMEALLSEHPWSRRGDRPAVRCEPVEREAGAA